MGERGPHDHAHRERGSGMSNNRYGTDSGMERYFSGRELYGDDFGSSEIAGWYEREREASAAGTHGWSRRHYDCHYVNQYHLFRFLPDREWESVLGYGSGYGYELKPFFGRARRLTVVEASSSYDDPVIEGVTINRVRATASGDLPFDRESFDLITCCSVLHHVPNVSHVLKEMSRIMMPQGYLAVREPIVSMGDWRKPRGRLTPCERGIPASLLIQFIRDAGLEVVVSRLWNFPILARASQILRKGRTPWNSPAWVWVDRWLAVAFQWNYRYHARHPVEKVRPTAICVLACKPGRV